MLTRFIPKSHGYKTPLIFLLTLAAIMGIAFFVSESTAFTVPITEEEEEEIYKNLPLPPGSGLPPPPELPEDLQNEISTDPFKNGGQGQPLLPKNA